MIDTQLTWVQKVAALAVHLGRKPLLDDLLPLAREHRMLPEEIKAQQESFVRAELGFGSDADEAAYRGALHQIEAGVHGALARLEEAKARSRARIASYGPSHARSQS